MIKFAGLEEIWLIIQDGWRDLASTDFSQLKYSDVDLAFKVAIALALFVLLKISWIFICRFFGWNKYSMKDSGHPISDSSKRGLLAGFFLSLSKVFLLASFVAIIFAIADPFVSFVKEEKRYTEARTRLDLKDVSGSMISTFRSSGKSKAETAMNAHLKFIKMRQGKNDRTAFWIFSDDPYPVQEDFVMDDELYYLKAFDAPWELSGSSIDSFTEEQWEGYAIPRSRVVQVAGQGGTQLSSTLKMAVKLFSEDEKRQERKTYYGYKNAGKAILIVTDAEISDFEQTKDILEELRKKKVIPYIIFIDATITVQDADQPARESELLKEVVSMGGKFFPVSDEKSLDNAYAEIDKLEKITVTVEKKVFATPVFHKFVFAAIIFLAPVILLGIIVEKFSDP
ncbi:MAG: hypothetical protein HYT63_03695 [Candidatus Yanofskybacteria bacterium]|nr:hypothetical protein [Candidatus Yanofskybacteria bacterium]